MKRLNQATALLLIGFSALIIVSSLKLGVGDFRAPGPGFMGFLASILLVVLSFIILIQESKKGGEEKEAFRWDNLYKPLIIIVALSLYALILDTLGFLLSSFLLVWVMLLISSPKRWFYHMVVAILIVNVSYLVLSKLLRVPFPVGIFRIQW
ncbi:MAG: tripartite tricarboxylate transporter TctB family protein [Thermodesulfobacteriota bacterium]